MKKLLVPAVMLGALILTGAGCYANQVPVQPQQPYGRPPESAVSSTLPNSQPSDTTASTSVKPSATAQSVTISNYTFSPASVTVKAGTTVKWTNNDSVPHTVTAADGSFNGSVAPGTYFSHTFTSAGTVTYGCTIHPSMTGQVVVQ